MRNQLLSVSSCAVEAVVPTNCMSASGAWSVEHEMKSARGSRHVLMCSGIGCVVSPVEFVTVGTIYSPPCDQEA